MRILVIEDEHKLGDYLVKGLTESGFVVDLARSGLEGRALALDGDYDLVVLDVMLPGIDGFAVLEAVRKIKSMPVLMLTARDEVADRVRGLQSGADDYLAKPFAFSELLARIQALLRRGKLHEVSNYALKDLHLDVVARRASRNGQRLDLTAKEFALLTLLMRRQGNVLSRTQLAEQVWDINFDSDTNIVEVAIRRLRSKIDDPFEEKLLHTVRGQDRGARAETGHRNRGSAAAAACAGHWVHPDCTVALVCSPGLDRSESGVSGDLCRHRVELPGQAGQRIRAPVRTDQAPDPGISR
jgi:two-component system, OmpR family, copper resistance phosphate regulon response regulator CusR